MTILRFRTNTPVQPQAPVPLVPAQPRPTPTSMPTLATLFDQYLAEMRLEHAPSTHYQQRLFFRVVLRDLGPLPLQQVTPDLLRTWKTVLTARYTRATIHRYMSFLNCALRYAVECEWLAVNPMAKVRKPAPGRGRMRF